MGNRQDDSSMCLEEANEVIEKKYISIDIGGTAIKYGILTEEGAILERYEMATEAYKGGPEILKKAEGIVEGFLNSGKVLKEELLGICISTAGMVDRWIRKRVRFFILRH